jgi:hypothetical protein
MTFFLITTQSLEKGELEGLVKGFVKSLLAQKELPLAPSFRKRGNPHSLHLGRGRIESLGFPHSSVSADGN